MATIFTTGAHNGPMANSLDEEPGFGEQDFGAPSSSIVSAFDAFPKAKPQYVTRTAGGGKWTVAMAFVSIFLIQSELSQWWAGSESHAFSVEKGVAHIMPLNIDIVVRMKCADLHINAQDAAGDRILAATKLQRDATNWAQWVDRKGVHKLGRDSQGRIVTGAGYVTLGTGNEDFGEEHVHDIVAAGSKQARFSKTPWIWGRDPGDSCRIYGTLELNKVQGDFHITARGHGYMEFAQHLDHDAFNFSHIISELSFGAFYPTLVNPLDRTVNLATAHFHKFQYYLSVVPTTYSWGGSVLRTNQYAVTEQSREVPDDYVPGIFVKYDIEPMLLSVEETRPSFLVFVFKVVNVLSGVLVTGHWGFAISECVIETWGNRKKRRLTGAGGLIGPEKGYTD